MVSRTVRRRRGLDQAETPARRSNTAHLTCTSESFGHLVGKGKVIDRSKEDHFLRSTPLYRAIFAEHSQDNTVTGLLC
jgi:hypothetical protein